MAANGSAAAPANTRKTNKPNLLLMPLPLPSQPADSVQY